MEHCTVYGKQVRNKPILGTLHFCLTDEEIAQQQHARWQQSKGSGLLNWAAFLGFLL